MAVAIIGAKAPVLDRPPLSSSARTSKATNAAMRTRQAPLLGWVCTGNKSHL